MNLFGTLVLSSGEIVAPGGSGPLAANVAATVVATEDSAVTTTVQPGDVIKTTPGKGSYPGGMPIAIVESSGAKSKKH